MSTENAMESFCSNELLSNSLLDAIRPGGVLYYAVERGPLETLLVPSQASLEEYGISNFLTLGAALTPSGGSSGEGKDPHHHQDPQSPGPPPSPHDNVPEKLRHITSEQHRAIATTLRTFLRYHLLHFESMGSRFITSQGHRGEISDTLDEIIRYGKNCRVAIIGDCDALKAASDRTLSPYHPLKLHIFFIQQPLMDSAELKVFTAELNSIIEPIRGARVVSRSTPQAPSGSPTGIEVYFNSPSLEANHSFDTSKPPTSAPLPPSTLSESSRIIDVDVSDEEELEDVVEEKELASFASRTADRDKRQKKRNKHHAVRTHDYSKESIVNYRRVVAADNNVNYDEFQIIMSKPFALPLVSLVSTFVEQAQRKNKIFYDNHLIVRFMSHFYEEAYRIRQLNTQEDTITTLAEGVEKYLTTKLYRKMFGVNVEVIKDNKALEEKLTALEDLTAHDLDALEEVEDHHVWGQAMFELDAMNFFKSPRDKLRCGMRACELLSLALRDVLHAGSPTTAEHTLAFGADEFVPCFMLLVLRARSFNYYANVDYIEQFRSPNLMDPEESYCLATLMSAAMFWLRCDGTGKIPSSSTSPHAPDASPTLPVSSIAERNSQNSSLTLPPAPSLRERDLLPSIQKGVLVGAADGTGGAPLTTATAIPETKKLESFKSKESKQSHSVLDSLFGWSSAANTANDVLMRLAGPAADSSRRPSHDKEGGEQPPPPSLSSPPSELSPSPAVRELLARKTDFNDLSVSEIKVVVDEMRRLCK